MENMDTMMLGLVITIGAIAVIAMVFITIGDEFQTVSTTDYTENFGVSDPSSDHVCGLTYNPVGDMTVRYYNGVAWSTLGAGDYTLAGSTVTVNAAAMD